jgi:hypothetical protein
VHAVRAEQVATFLGKKFDRRYTGEVGNDFSTRIQGTRIRHQMGESTVKMYDKLGRVLRIETVTNDVSFFRHHRSVEHRDGTLRAPVVHHGPVGNRAKCSILGSVSRSRTLPAPGSDPFYIA